MDRPNLEWVVASPKQKDPADETRASWFPYYAGYSGQFVRDILTIYGVNNRSTVLDPWVGSGTTSEIAASRGHRVSGFDINPAAVTVARARATDSGTSASLLTAAELVCKSFATILIRKATFVESGPLARWFTAGTVRSIRALKLAIDASASEFGRALPSLNPRDRSGIHAILYVAMFRTVRRYLAQFRGSNPTWIKASTEGPRVNVPVRRLFDSFIEEAEYLATTMLCEPQMGARSNRGVGVISQACSSKLPIRDASVDLVITSPPYCTRIDYVRATLPELAALGLSEEYIRKLNERMIGTTTMARPRIDAVAICGKTCMTFLDAVRHHESKASSTYYLRYFHQYFASIYASLSELNRVLKKESTCVLVVQDSFYKEVLNDLPTVFCEMGEGLGWNVEQKLNFKVGTTLAATNPKVRKYRTCFGATESALIFKKG